MNLYLKTLIINWKNNKIKTKKQIFKDLSKFEDAVIYARHCADVLNIFTKSSIDNEWKEVKFKHKDKFQRELSKHFSKLIKE